jgi:hypothetical protein
VGRTIGTGYLPLPTVRMGAFKTMWASVIVSLPALASALIWSSRPEARGDTRLPGHPDSLPQRVVVGLSGFGVEQCERARGGAAGDEVLEGRPFTILRPAE